MNCHWINRKQNPVCILFFNGWGMDENAIAHLGMGDTDLCMFNNYTTLDPLDAGFTSYRSLVLVAWSLGIWAAGQVLPESDIHPDQSIAINGTSVPMHDQLGIPESIFARTLQYWTEEGRSKFNRRMMNGNVDAGGFGQYMPNRSISDQKEELQSIYETVSGGSSQSIPWNKAVIGQNDLIFPVANQKNWWNGKTKIIETPWPHFPFMGFRHWEELLKL